MTTTSPPRRSALALLALGALLLLSLASATMTPVNAHAQAPPADAHATPEEAALREQVRERIRQARNQMLTEELGLDESNAKALFSRLDAHVEQEHQGRRELRAARKRLGEALDATPPPADATLQSLTRAVIDAQKDLDALRVTLYEDTAAMLTPQQHATLVLALPRFERKVRRLIRKARGKRKKGPRRGQPRGDGGRPRRR